MTRDISTTVLGRIEDNVVYPFYAIELLFDGFQTLRLWTGLGGLVYGGNTWYGTGEILTVDTIEETTEISAKGAVLTLSAIPTEVLSLALTQPYQGRKCNIYFGMFDPAGGQIVNAGDLTQIFSGYMDQMNIQEDGSSSTLTLSVENKLVDLERARVARFTSAYQKSRYPNDKGLDFVEALQTQSLVWGRKE